MIRTRRTRRSSACAAALSLVLVAAACGSDDDEDASDTTDTTAEGVEAIDAETAAATEDGDSGEDFPESITFAAVPAEESSSLQDDYEPIIEAIRQELGVEVEFVQAADYAGVIEGMIAGNVDVAQFGPFSYVLAKQNGADIEAIGAMIDGPGEEPGYQSYGITRGDNDAVSGLADFAGRTVCFVDPGSTSGFLYPVAGLIEEGIVTSAAEGDLAAGVTPTFAGGHDASVLSVVSGDCEVGFAYDSMVEVQLVEDGAIQEGDVKVVWESEVIAGSPMAISSELPEEFREAFTALLIDQVNAPGLVDLGICPSEDECGITDEGGWGYASVDDGYYDGVRAVCTTTRSPQCEEG